MEIVRLRGRLYEPGLIGFYNLLRGDLFKDFDLALPMVIQGKLKPWQFPGIGDIEALQRMVEKCNQFAEEERAQKQ